MKVKIFFGILSLIIVINTSKLAQELILTSRLRRHLPFYFQGLKFSGLENILQGEETVGYYTDKDLNTNAEAAQFSQAQYVLAPLVLDLNYGRHNFILLDCSSEEKALAKIKELGAVALRKNKFGIILARTNLK